MIDYTSNLSKMLAFFCLTAYFIPGLIFVWIIYIKALTADLIWLQIDLQKVSQQNLLTLD